MKNQHLVKLPEKKVEEEAEAPEEAPAEDLKSKNEEVEAP
jgi:hypothetical protein